MPKLTARTLLVGGVQSASGQGSAVEIGPDTTLDLILTVTALTAGQTLSVFVETGPDGTLWTEVVPKTDDGNPAKFAVVSATGSQFVVFPECDRFVRVRWVLSGGSATFGVSGSSVRVYAKPSDLHRIGLEPSYLPRVGSRKLDAAIREQTDITDSAVGMHYTVPLTTWGDDIRGGVVACAAASFLASEGIRAGQDELVAARCKEYDDWLDLVAQGKRRPAGAVDLTPTVDESGGYAVSDARRGW